MIKGINDHDELNIVVHKVHRLPLNSTKTQYRKAVPNVIFCLKSHSFREKLHAKRKMIYERSEETMNFHVSLTKEQSALLEKAQIHINGIGGVRFCF